MSKVKKPQHTNTAFAIGRRAFLGAGALAGGIAASGLAGAAGAAPVRRTSEVEPHMTDAHSNAPSYSAHPKVRRPAAVDGDPLARALGGE